MNFLLTYGITATDRSQSAIVAATFTAAIACLCIVSLVVAP